jgi:hypothetical protein
MSGSRLQAKAKLELERVHRVALGSVRSMRRVVKTVGCVALGLIVFVGFVGITADAGIGWGVAFLAGMVLAWRAGSRPQPTRALDLLIVVAFALVWAAMGASLDADAGAIRLVAESVVVGVAVSLLASQKMREAYATFGAKVRRR